MPWSSGAVYSVSDDHVSLQDIPGSNICILHESIQDHGILNQSDDYEKFTNIFFIDGD